MILLLNFCRERLHYYEFVRPVEDILEKGGFDFETFHYMEEINLSKFDKVIICGTSLRDCDYLENLDKFDWLKDFRGKVFGICAGMQVLGLLFGGELKKKKEIGFFREKFDREFLGLSGEVEVYHLHGNYVEFGEEWEVFNSRSIAQAVKCKEKDFYGVLFHPEVRNKEMILRFVGG